jgi:hypothetical protein
LVLGPWLPRIMATVWRGFWSSYLQELGVIDYYLVKIVKIRPNWCYDWMFACSYFIRGNFENQMMYSKSGFTTNSKPIVKIYRRQILTMRGFSWCNLFVFLSNTSKYVRNEYSRMNLWVFPMDLRKTHMFKTKYLNVCISKGNKPDF